MGAAFKLSPEQCAQIKDFLEKGTYSIQELAEMYNVSHMTIRRRAMPSSYKAQVPGRRAPELAGKKFGKLTVIERVPPPKRVTSKNASFWRCDCDCGGTTVVRATNLMGGKTRRCMGCRYTTE